MRLCPLLKARGRPRDYACGAYHGKCSRKEDKTVRCPIRDGDGGEED